jgi:hypothetical protein
MLIQLTTCWWQPSGLVDPMTKRSREKSILILTPVEALAAYERRQRRQHQYQHWSTTASAPVAVNGSSTIELSRYYLAVGCQYKQSNELRNDGVSKGVPLTKVDNVTERHVHNAAGEIRDSVRSQQLNINALPV